MNENRLALVNGAVFLNISNQLLRSYNFIHIYFCRNYLNEARNGGFVKYSKVKEIFTSFVIVFLKS